jgi:hypothetical protein
MVGEIYDVYYIILLFFACQTFYINKPSPTALDIISSYLIHHMTCMAIMPIYGTLWLKLSVLCGVWCV